MPDEPASNQEQVLIEKGHRTTPKPRKHGQSCKNVSWPKQIWHKCCDTWFFELASNAFSALCIIAIFIFLRVLNGKETPSWSSSVSLNAIIAVASTASKASAILAATGALGQFKWLHLRTKDHR